MKFYIVGYKMIKVMEVSVLYIIMCRKNLGPIVGLTYHNAIYPFLLGSANLPHHTPNTLQQDPRSTCLVRVHENSNSPHIGRGLNLETGKSLPLESWPLQIVGTMLIDTISTKVVGKDIATNTIGLRGLPSTGLENVTILHVYEGVD